MFNHKRVSLPNSCVTCWYWWHILSNYQERVGYLFVMITTSFIDKHVNYLAALQRLSIHIQVVVFTPIFVYILRKQPRTRISEENMKFMSFFVQRQSKVFNEKNERNWRSPTPYWKEIADTGWFSCTPYFYTGPIGKGEWRRWIRTILWSMEYVSLTELRTRTVS